MRKTLKVLMLALVCSAFCWADCHTLDLSVVIVKDFMVIGARGGFSPNIFYTTLSDRYGTRYVTLHRESADDPGRIVWALYSEKDGLLDSVIVDKKHRMYKAVGLGEGGIMPPPLKKKLKHHDKNVVEAPLSALDEVVWNLVEYRKNAEDRPDTNDILFMLEPNGNREEFLQWLRSYKPLVQAAKNIGFSFLTFGLLDDADSSYGDWAKLSKDMYDAVGVRMPSQDELKKHKRCSCVLGAALEGTPATPYSRGVLEILKGVGKPQNK